MKAYLAAPYAARDTVRELARDLGPAGVTVTSSWLTETAEINPGTVGAASALDDESVHKHVAADFRDIDDADMLVLFTAASLGIDGGGGRHVETGYAMAMRMPVVVIGEPENVFHRGYKRAVIVSDWRSALAHLTAVGEP